MGMNPSSPVASAPHAGGILLLRRTFDAVFIWLGALLLAFAAGSALNLPTSDTVMFTITATNTGTKTIGNGRIDDTAGDELGGTLSCPGAPLELRKKLSCNTDIAGKADSAQATRIISGVLVGAASLTAGILVLRFPRRPSVTETGPEA
ncbi:hypothetical protein C5C17_10830 [Pseudoclavibacter sp. RFBA6]|nr:hypothetical protein C5C17_10830 [Pseudoclavibacter sp. RFBA6]